MAATPSAARVEETRSIFRPEAFKTIQRAAPAKKSSMMVRPTALTTTGTLLLLTIARAESEKFREPTTARR